MTWLPFRSIRLTGLVCFGLLIKRLQMPAHSGAFPLWTIGLLPTRALQQGLQIIWVWSVARLGVVSALFPRVPDFFLVFPATSYVIIRPLLRYRFVTARCVSEHFILSAIDVPSTRSFGTCVSDPGASTTCAFLGHYRN
jgi:hypothetical protein